MKKKITAIVLCVALLAIAVVGASLAYFTDKDAKDNVFTTGKVDITLDENFEQNSKLLPATGSAQTGTLQNGVDKQIAVTVEDGSGRGLTGLWTGRTRLPGIELGAGLVMTGTVAAERDGSLRMRNPEYATIAGPYAAL